MFTVFDGFQIAFTFITCHLVLSTFLQDKQGGFLYPCFADEENKFP